MVDLTLCQQCSFALAATCGSDNGLLAETGDVIRCIPAAVRWSLFGQPAAERRGMISACEMSPEINLGVAESDQRSRGTASFL
jgi:hypothetical protein